MFAYDRQENSLNLISNKGDFIDTYTEHGKGPGEIVVTFEVKNTIKSI